MGYMFERNATFTNFSISKIDKEKPQAYANLYELLLLFKPIPNPAILKCKVIRLLFFLLSSYCIFLPFAQYNDYSKWWRFQLSDFSGSRVKVQAKKKLCRNNSISKKCIAGIEVDSKLIHKEKWYQNFTSLMCKDCFTSDWNWINEWKKLIGKSLWKKWSKEIRAKFYGKTMKNNLILCRCLTGNDLSMTKWIQASS